MRATEMTKSISIARLLFAPMMALFLAAAAHAGVPGITGGSLTTGTAATFNLTAQQAYLNQPDGNAVYSWGYGCNGSATFATTLGNATFPNANCPSMQVPGPTLIVTEGQTVTVNLVNGLPTAAGNTSILFPDFQLTSTCAAAQQGLLTCEATPAGTVTYTFVASKPGTHAYYSGTQGDLQIEMGLYGAIIVLPKTVTANCTTGLAATNRRVEQVWGESDFRLSQAAYDHPGSCYDREYLFQWAEMDTRIHQAALAQVLAKVNCAVTSPTCKLEVPTEPYHPAYFLINGRSMPDVMDANYAPEYPHQPYNGNPHMHPGEQVLVRTIGQGRWQHPFHEHGNHVRILARDGNLVLSNSTTLMSYSTPGGSAVSAPALAGLLMFNTDTTPGQAFDGIFYWTGRGLNWDPYGHHIGSDTYGDSYATVTCTPDVNGYYTGITTFDKLHTINYYEWCQDHDKPVEATPFGDVTQGGPTTLPNPNILTNGAWYGGTPYLGPDATLRAFAPTCATTSTATLTCSSQQPSNTQANPPNERGYAFMWHSHNEREITTNNVFPGGMLMMMLVDSREFVIDESF
jgi:FtsP/CotA-like multicopper oxidase with cupredoxin domain